MLFCRSCSSSLLTATSLNLVASLESDSQASGRSTKRTKLEGEEHDGNVKEAEKESVRCFDATV